MYMQSCVTISTIYFHFTGTIMEVFALHDTAMTACYLPTEARIGNSVFGLSVRS